MKGASNFLATFLSLVLLWTRQAWAFSIASRGRKNNAYKPLPSSLRRKTSSTTTVLGLSDRNADGFMEISNTLARLDQQWRLQQKSRATSRWTKIVLGNEQDGTQAQEFAPEAPVPPSLQENLVYLLEPPNQSNPSCILTFIGGAGLGSFPQIAYNEFLTRLSDRLNAAVIAAPYQVGLDHFALSQRTGDLIRRAILHLEEDPARLYSPQLRTYCLAHSLGCKLATIYMAATGQEFDGIGFICYNNFGFANTISMVREFAEEIQKGTKFGNSRRGMDSGTLNSLFALAENVLGSLKFDFTPSPAETERVISLKYDPERQGKTRLFVFDDDNLDSSASFLQACSNERQTATVSALPGNHLTPVYFKLGLDSLPEEARSMASDSLGGFQNVSFGNIDELSALVDEVYGFILGKEPSRQPSVPLLAANDEN